MKKRTNLVRKNSAPVASPARASASPFHHGIPIFPLRSGPHNQSLDLAPLRTPPPLPRRSPPPSPTLLPHHHRPVPRDMQAVRTLASLPPPMVLRSRYLDPPQTLDPDSTAASPIRIFMVSSAWRGRVAPVRRALQLLCDVLGRLRCTVCCAAVGRPHWPWTPPQPPLVDF
jgi:hypothetical protein